MNPELRSDVRAELRTGVLVVAGCALTGIVVGILWWQLAPLPRVEVRGDGLFLVGGETELAIAADGRLAAISATAGLVVTLVVFAVSRRARLGPLLGLVLGGFVGSVLAWRLGVLLGPGNVQATAKGLADGSRFDGPLKLSARGVLFVWPLISTVAYFALTAGLEPAASRGRRGALEAGHGARSLPVTVLRPGYSIAEVDDAFARIDAGQLTADELRTLRFPSRRWSRAYDEVSVDAEIGAAIERLNRPSGDDRWAPPSPG